MKQDWKTKHRERKLRPQSNSTEDMTLKSIKLSLLTDWWFIIEFKSPMFSQNKEEHTYISSSFSWQKLRILANSRSISFNSQMYNQYKELLFVLKVCKVN